MRAVRMVLMVLVAAAARAAASRVEAAEVPAVWHAHVARVQGVFHRPDGHRLHPGEGSYRCKLPGGKAARDADKMADLKRR